MAWGAQLKRGSGMDQKTLNEYKQWFISEIKRLASDHPVKDDSIRIDLKETKDELDLSSIEHHQRMILRLRNRDSLYLKKIEAALGRINQGTFGECKECGEMIGERRLKARPTAALCIECKEEQENTENHFADGRTSKSARVLGGAKLA